MNALAHRPQSPQRQRHPRRVLISAAVSLMLVGAVVWLLGIEGVIQSSWSAICGAIFTVLGACLALIQLIVQLTPSSASAHPTGTPNRQRLLHRVDVPLHVAGNEGAIVVYTKNYLVGLTIHLSSDFDAARLKSISAASVVERTLDGQTVFVGIFPTLAPGNYTVYTSSREYITNVTVYAGHITEVDWRQVP